MNDKPINLRLARKRRGRLAKAKAGDASAAIHGLSRGEREGAKAREALAARRLDGHRRDDDDER